jgi:hypothetical protein
MSAFERTLYLHKMGLQARGSTRFIHLARYLLDDVGRDIFPHATCKQRGRCWMGKRQLPVDDCAGTGLVPKNLDTRTNGEITGGVLEALGMDGVLHDWRIEGNRDLCYLWSTRQAEAIVTWAPSRMEMLLKGTMLLLAEERRER